MKRWITSDDFVELFSKLKQRGSQYLFSKLNPSARRRTQSTFGESSFQHANWWIVPAVRQRWNEKVTGDPDKIYEDYFVEKYLQGRQGLSALALGSGIGSHERQLARHQAVFSSIKAYDIAPNLIRRANQLALEEGLENIEFICADVNEMNWGVEQYDLIFFHSSLHHFLNLDELIGQRIPAALKPDGLLLLNDYWGPDRLQWSVGQLQTINRLLKTFPARYARRFKSRMIKRRVSGPGWVRMRISDPSEAAESSRIKPLLRTHFTTLEETPIGGNILMPLLKDIAHHFVDPDTEERTLLQECFAAEDEFLAKEDSLLFFGVYQKK
jgi:2-polyprenyl-3-methyl-5-hydroxy-6-metoxy-1,4-benzoquinol methylase